MSTFVVRHPVLGSLFLSLLASGCGSSADGASSVPDDAGADSVAVDSVVADSVAVDSAPALDADAAAIDAIDATDATDATDTAAATDTSTDAPDGSDAAVGPWRCGAAPLDPITLNLDSTISFKGAGTFTSNGCTGGFSWVSGSGPIPTSFTDGVAVWIRLDAFDPKSTLTFPPTYFPEVKPIPGFTKYVGSVIWDSASIAKYHTMVPSYDPPTMSLVTVITVLPKPASAAPCDVMSGVTYSVPGHAEAVVMYGSWKAGTVAAGTATDASGEAIITLLPKSSLEYVSVVGTKTGCTIMNAVVVYTGRVPIAPGTTSAGFGYEP